MYDCTNGTWPGGNTIFIHACIQIHYSTSTCAYITPIGTHTHLKSYTLT